MPPHKNRGPNFGAVRIVVHRGVANNGNLLETLVREQTSVQVHMSHALVTFITAFLVFHFVLLIFLSMGVSVSEMSLLR